MPAVGISRRFFKQVPKDYSDWRFALIREAVQNAADSGASQIIFEILPTPAGDTVMSFSNDGAVMSRDTLENKLLTLGETTKGDEATGGMGVAKAILYFTHLDYAIHSGSLLVKGSGGNYEVEEAEFFDGTKNVITIEGDHSEALIRKVKTFCLFAQWKGVVTLNGTDYECRCRKGAFRRDLGFCKVYTNNLVPGILVVRSGGQPMFTQSIDLKKTVVVELNLPSKQYLTSNRDGLTHPFRYELGDFIQELASDSSSALKNREATTYTVFGGALVEKIKQDREAPKSTAVSDLAQFSGDSEAEGEVDGTGVALEVAVSDRQERAALVASLTTAPARREIAAEEMAEEGYNPKPWNRQGPDGFRFLIRNESGMRIPGYYMPGDMSDYAAKVIRWYRNCIRVALWLYKVEGSFSVGFSFGDDEGLHERGAYGSVFYINPISIVQQKNSQSRSMKRRYSLDARGRWEIAALAMHEVTHTFVSAHNEEFSSILTDGMARALQERTLLASCFR